MSGVKVKRYSIAGIAGTTPAGWHEYVLATDHDAEVTRLRAALQRIVDWQLPRKADEKGVFYNYGYWYGSNGERDYMRGIARIALSESEATT